MRDVLREIAALKRRVARLEAQDKFEFEPWTGWTPELYGTTTAGTITYSTQIGFYLLLDAVVFVYGLLSVSTIPVAPTGNLRIRTLPYAAVNAQPLSYSGRSNLSAGYTYFQCRTGTGLTDVILQQAGDDLNQAFPAANLNTSFDIQFTGFYRIT